MTEEPHVTLNRAADLLEQRAGKAAPGPWYTPPDDSIGEWVIYDAQWAVAEANAYSHNDPYSNNLGARGPGYIDPNANAEWIAMMSPAVAVPLALWLRTAAKQWKIAVDLLRPERALWIERERYAGALGFARMVLGEATEAAGIPVVIHREDS